MTAPPLPPADQALVDEHGQRIVVVSHLRNGKALVRYLGGQTAQGEAELSARQLARFAPPSPAGPPFVGRHITNE